MSFVHRESPVLSPHSRDSENLHEREENTKEEGKERGREIIRPRDTTF